MAPYLTALNSEACAYGPRHEPGSRAWMKRAAVRWPGRFVAAAAILPAKWAESGLPPELEGFERFQAAHGRAARKVLAFLNHVSEVQFAIAQVGAGQN